MAEPGRGQHNGSSLRGALTDAGLAAVLALALLGPLVGVRVVTVAGQPAVEPHFAAVASAAALIFLGRLARSALTHGWERTVAGLSMALGVALLLANGSAFPGEPLRTLALLGTSVILLQAVLALARRRRRTTTTPRWRLSLAGMVRRQARWGAPLALLLALALPALLYAGDAGLGLVSVRRGLDIAILLLAYVMLGWGLNIVVGLAGLLDLGYVAFYAVGAYAYALLAQSFGLGFWTCLPLAGIMAAVAGLALGFPVLRLRGDYFAIVTLGFGEIVRIILINWTGLTGGPNGIGGIPRPTFFGHPFTALALPGDPSPFHQLMGIGFSRLHQIIFLYYIALGLALLVNAFILRVRKLPLGRAWEALREDDIAATALGINRTSVKLAAFACGALFGGFAGAFFATRQGFISPESFTFMESATIVAIVVLGGMGSQTGVVLATLLVIGVPELARELAQYRLVFFGAGMVAIMLWRPQGLLGTRAPTVRLNSGPLKGAIEGEDETLAAEVAR